MDEKSMKTCSGCGVKLQDENVLQEGYTTREIEALTQIPKSSVFRKIKEQK